MSNMKLYSRTEEVRAFKIGYTNGNTFASETPNEKSGRFAKSAVVLDLAPELVTRYSPKVGQYLSFLPGSGQFHGVHAAPWFEENYDEVGAPVGADEES